MRRALMHPIHSGIWLKPHNDERNDPCCALEETALNVFLWIALWIVTLIPFGILTGKAIKFGSGK